jgi:hypothetical protein
MIVLSTPWTQKSHPWVSPFPCRSSFILFILLPRGDITEQLIELAPNAILFFCSRQVLAAKRKDAHEGLFLYPTASCECCARASSLLAAENAPPTAKDSLVIPALQGWRLETRGREGMLYNGAPGKTQPCLPRFHATAVEPKERELALGYLGTSQQRDVPVVYSN